MIVFKLQLFTCGYLHICTDNSHSQMTTHITHNLLILMIAIGGANAWSFSGWS